MITKIISLQVTLAIASAIPVKLHRGSFPLPEPFFRNSLIDHRQLPEHRGLLNDQNVVASERTYETYVPRYQSLNNVKRSDINGQYDGGQLGSRYQPEDSFTAFPNYKFLYNVQDEQSGNDYGHEESRDGSNVKGSYHVLLPDGRKQIVNYYVNGNSGFVAEVTYEGEALVSPPQKHYNTFSPSKSSSSYKTVPSFKPALSYNPAPLYKPAPSHKSASTYKPAPSYKPEPSYKPASTYKPAPSYKPAYSYEPASTYKPAPSYQPASNYKPAPSYKPKSTYKPAPQYKPAVSYKPAPQYKPAPSYKPASNYKPVTSYKPSQSNKPTYTYKPAPWYNPERNQEKSSSFKSSQFYKKSLHDESVTSNEPEEQEETVEATNDPPPIYKPVQIYQTAPDYSPPLYYPSPLYVPNYTEYFRNNTVMELIVDV